METKDSFCAVAFAEAGEFDTAISMLPVVKSKITLWDKFWLSVTFAEAGEIATASDFLTNKPVVRNKVELFWEIFAACDLANTRYRFGAITL